MANFVVYDVFRRSEDPDSEMFPCGIFLQTSLEVESIVVACDWQNSQPN